MENVPPTPTQVLDTPMPDNDAEATTVRGYLVELLATLWHQEEGFSGKRPFGNSSWTHELYAALGDAGFIRYVRNEDGYCEDVDSDLGRKLIADAIQALGEPAADACRPFDGDTCHDGCGCPQSHE